MAACLLAQYVTSWLARLLTLMLALACLLTDFLACSILTHPFAACLLDCLLAGHWYLCQLRGLIYLCHLPQGLVQKLVKTSLLGLL